MHKFLSDRRFLLGLLIGAIVVSAFFMMGPTGKFSANTNIPSNTPPLPVYDPFGTGVQNPSFEDVTDDNWFMIALGPATVVPEISTEWASDGARSYKLAGGAGGGTTTGGLVDINQVFNVPEAASEISVDLHVNEFPGITLWSIQLCDMTCTEGQSSPDFNSGEIDSDGTHTFTIGVPDALKGEPGRLLLRSHYFSSSDIPEEVEQYWDNVRIS